MKESKSKAVEELMPNQKIGQTTRSSFWNETFKNEAYNFWDNSDMGGGADFVLFYKERNKSFCGLYKNSRYLLDAQQITVRSILQDCYSFKFKGLFHIFLSL